MSTTGSTEKYSEEWYSKFPNEIPWNIDINWTILETPYYCSQDTHRRWKQKLRFYFWLWDSWLFVLAISMHAVVCLVPYETVVTQITVSTYYLSSKNITDISNVFGIHDIVWIMYIMLRFLIWKIITILNNYCELFLTPWTSP
jgi:hypothetical protein